MNRFPRWSRILPWLVACWVVLSANWAAEELKKAFGVWFQARPAEGLSMMSVLMYCGLFVGAVVTLYLMRRTLLYPQTRYLRNEKPPPQREHLVLFLSNLDPGKVQEGIPQGLTLSGELDDDLKSMAAFKKSNPYWPWEMPLRGIKHHLGRLQSIVLICSEKSLPQVHWFGRILQTCYGKALQLPSAPTSSWQRCKRQFQNWIRALRRQPPLKLPTQVAVRVWIRDPHKGARLLDCPTEAPAAGGWNFEAFDELSGALVRLVRYLDDQGAKEDEVMIDFSGGQKVTSVVAASVTFNTRVKAQYVQTNDPWEPIGYDVVLTNSLTEGMGW